MKKMYAKVIPLVLLFTMIISSFGFAALSFTDTGDHWASETIERVSSKNIMPGFSDATFKADTNVTKLEAIVTIYRVMKMAGKVSSDNEVSLVAKHKETIESLGIPAMLAPYGADTYVAAAYALENNIIEVDELKYFINNGKLSEAKKIDVSIFIAKAINAYEKENLENKFIDFSFTDSRSINRFSAPYVYSLVEKNIISSSGDANGNFNPSNSVTRAILATMTLGTYDYMLGAGESTSSSSNSSSTSTSTGTSNVELATYTGKITVIHSDKGLIEVRDSLNRLKVYDTTNIAVYINGDLETPNKLLVGQSAKFSFSGSRLNKIEVEKTYNVVSGYIDQISVVGEDTPGKYTVVSVKTPTGKKEYFKAFASTYISLNGVESSLAKLAINDKINVSYESYEAKRIEAFGKVYEIGGSAIATVELISGSKLSLKMNDGGIFENTITDATIVSSVNKMVRKGDIVRVTLEYGVVKKVENTGMRASDSGNIIEILISNTPKITILNTENIKKTYALKSDALLYSQDGTILSDIYELRLDSNVNLELDVDGISKITASKKIDKVKFQGKITEIFKASNIFKITSSDSTKTYIVNFKSGSDISLETYNVGDDVYIVGVELSNELFEADLIINTN
ncbi:MAG: S-layer homology domain-containing protein [Acidaminobacteraceae bacterium]